MFNRRSNPLKTLEKANLEPSDIRRSVEPDGWDSRAGQVLSWLSEVGS